MTVWGTVSAPVSAGRDADLWTFGTSSQSLTAGGNATLTAWDSFSGTIEAGRNAGVAVFADFSGNVEAHRNADVWVEQQAGGSVTTHTGDVALTALGNAGTEVNAGWDATLTTFGVLASPVTAGGNAEVYAYGDSAELDIEAAGSADIFSTGTVTGTVDAQNISLLALDAAQGLTITAGNAADVTVDGEFQGTITAASGDVSLFASGPLGGTVAAGGDASVASLAGIAGLQLTAAGAANVTSLGPVAASGIAGDAEVFVWSYGGLTSLTVGSAGGPVNMITNGPASGLDVLAAGEVLLASIGSTLEATVTAGGSAAVFGFGVTASVTSGGSVDVASFGPLLLQLDGVAGDARIASTGPMAVFGAAAGDVRLVSYSSLQGTVYAGHDLWAYAIGTIIADLSAGNMVDTVATYSSLGGTVSAPVVRGVYVWDDLIGSVTAAVSIGEVYVGDEILPGAVIAAPAVGLVAEHDRSAFTDDPAMPYAAIGSVVSLAKDAYTQLLDLAASLAESKAELEAMVAAARADAGSVLAQARVDLANVRAEGEALLADIRTQGKLAADRAKMAVDWAILEVQTELDAANREAQDTSAAVTEDAAQQLGALEGEAAARFAQGRDEYQFLQSEAAKAEERFAATRAAELARIDALKDTYTLVFVGTFIRQLEGYALDVVHEQLEVLGTLGDFIPGVGWAIAAGADLINAAIYAAEGEWIDMGASVFSIIPFGNIAKRAGLDEAAGRVGKFAFRRAGDVVETTCKAVLPKLGKRAEELYCPIVRVFGRFGHVGALRTRLKLGPAKPEIPTNSATRS